jgi:hypothetical protein
VFRGALEAQDAEDSWTDEERRALASHIDEGFLQAERGELIDGAQARHGNSGVERYLASRAFAQGVSAYLTHASRQSRHLRDLVLHCDNADAADRVEQPIYDACALLADAPLHRHFRPDLTTGTLRF